MRQELLSQWPALSHLFGLHPWDIDRLTAREVAAYRAALDDYQKTMKQ